MAPVAFHQDPKFGWFLTPWFLTPSTRFPSVSLIALDSSAKAVYSLLSSPNPLLTSSTNLTASVLCFHTSIPKIVPLLCFCNQHRLVLCSCPNTSPAFPCLSVQPPGAYPTTSRKSGDLLTIALTLSALQCNPFLVF